MNHEPLRTETASRQEIEGSGKMQQKGYTLIPLKIYFKALMQSRESSLAKASSMKEGFNKERQNRLSRG